MTCDGMPGNFRVTLSIRRMPEKELVYFKQEGERFNHSRTLKFNIDTTYTIDVGIRPPHFLTSFVIHGFMCEATETKQDENCSSYHVEWTSKGVDSNKNGKRDDVSIEITIEERGTLSGKVQCKWYKYRETVHSKWGQPMNALEFDCMPSPNSDVIDILKTKYL